ncbi:AraC family transcriptional regulator [Paenibacillus sp. F6_3S_P_1C]|uniref:AraC family transcriptional regulator n=1 Tax=Paenibacillus vandeheii TaxID=3035917 RepID=A0ABT8JCW4_9BACL|nr:AraC family transcriptional regulator [Paenibacillus vandeheii]MDN4602951.1 AraC family transcriptional regulator [Paenibacillus vandeheii]
MNGNYLYDPIQPELLYLHRVTTYPLESSYHRHDAYEVYLFLRGNVNFYIENHCYHLEPGDLLVISPEEMHRSYIMDESEYERITINLKKSYLRRMSTSSTSLSACFDYRPKGKGNIVHLDQEQLKQLLQLAGELENLLASDAYGADVKINAVVAQLMVAINVSFHNTTSIPTDIMPELVCKTMDYIEEHLAQEITLSKLAEMFYINSTHISRQFKKHTGLTLRSYILGRRIELAKYCLSDGLSITETCFQSGFRDYANFIRSFTRIVGISPGKFVKQECNNADYGYNRIQLMI